MNENDEKSSMKCCIPDPVDAFHPSLQPLAPIAPESSSETLSTLYEERIDAMTDAYAKMSADIEKDVAAMTPNRSTPANVLPIHPGMPIGGPRLDPMTQLFQSLGMNFATLTEDRASAKGRAWDLLCACARRAPVDETDVRQALKLAVLFEDEWRKHEEIEQSRRAVLHAEPPKPPKVPGR